MAKTPIVARAVTIINLEVRNDYNHRLGNIDGFLCFFTIYCNEHAHHIFGQAEGLTNWRIRNIPGGWTQGSGFIVESTIKAAGCQETFGACKQPG